MDRSGIECLKSVVGIQRKIGAANGYPMFKGEEAGSLRKLSPESCAYLWFETWQQYFLSSLPLCEDWGQMVVYCMMIEDLQSIYCLWNSCDCTSIIQWFSHFDWATLTIFELESKVVQLHNEVSKETIEVEADPSDTPAATGVRRR